MARNPVTFSNGTLVQKAQVEIDGTTYDVEPAQYDGTTPLSANNLNLLQTRLYDYIDEKSESVQTYKETVQPSGSYSNQMPINICWKKMGKMIIVDMSITITKTTSGTTNSGLILPNRYSFNIPVWATPSSSYNNINYANNENYVLLGNYRDWQFGGFNSGMLDLTGSCFFNMTFYYDKTAGDIKFSGSYANSDTNNNKTLYTKIIYTIN